MLVLGLKFLAPFDLKLELDISILDVLLQNLLNNTNSRQRTAFCECQIKRAGAVCWPPLPLCSSCGQRAWKQSTPVSPAATGSHEWLALARHGIQHEADKLA